MKLLFASFGVSYLLFGVNGQAYALRQTLVEKAQQGQSQAKQQGLGFLPEPRPIINTVLSVFGQHGQLPVKPDRLNVAASRISPEVMTAAALPLAVIPTSSLSTTVTSTAGPISYTSGPSAAVQTNAPNSGSTSSRTETTNSRTETDDTKPNPGNLVVSTTPTASHSESIQTGTVAGMLIGLLVSVVSFAL